MTISDTIPATADIGEATRPVTPPASPALGTSHPLRGVLMVMLAVLLFACNDATTKFLVTDYNVPMVSAARYIVHCLLMVAILGPRQGRQLIETRRTGLVLVRALCLVVATACMGLAFQRMPVAESTALVFLAPMAVVLVARPVLGEKIGALGWAAAIIGFIGILLIVRPGSGLDPWGVVSVLGAVAVTVVYYLLSRILASTERTLALLFYSALVGAICFGLLLPWFWTGEAPTLLQTALFLSMGVTAGTGHFLFTAAHRDAPASLLAPISYMQLVWAGLLGWIVFGHVPDGLTILGMAVVAASGVMIALKSSRRPRGIHEHGS